VIAVWPEKPKREEEKDREVGTSHDMAKPRRLLYQKTRKGPFQCVAAVTKERCPCVCDYIQLDSSRDPTQAR
jgi:hypothetical protein